MKKRLILTSLLLLVAALLAACGSSGSVVELSQELVSDDGSFSVYVPESWGYYDAIEQDGMVLTGQNYDTAYISVYFYNNVDYFDDLGEWTADLEEFYGESLIGETKELEVSGMDATAMQYSMVDLSEFGDEYNYHGLEYLIKTDMGIVEIDINYAQGKIEGQIFDPSEDDLELLARIAETFTVN